MTSRPEHLPLPKSQPKLIDFMVVAYRASDGRYFYARETITEDFAQLLPEDRLAAFMFQNLVHDVLRHVDPKYGRIGDDAEWRGETAVRVLPDLDEFLDS